MINKNIAFLFLSMVFVGHLFAEKETAPLANIKTEQKIESDRSRIFKGIAGGLGALACAYLNAVILNWCFDKRRPESVIASKVDKVGLFFFGTCNIKNKSFGMPNAKLMTTFLLGLPTALLGIYLTKIAAKKLLTSSLKKENHFINS